MHRGAQPQPNALAECIRLSEWYTQAAFKPRLRKNRLKKEIRALHLLLGLGLVDGGVQVTS